MFLSKQKGEILTRDSLRFAMKFVVDFFKVSICNMRINLRRRDVGVAKHGLDAADVSAVHEKVGSEAVSHGVRADVFGNAG